MRRTRLVSALLAITVALSGSAVAAQAAAKPKPGATCSKVGATALSGGLRFTCQKKGSKKVWSKGVPAGVPTPKPTTNPDYKPDAAPSVPALTGDNNPKAFLTPGSPNVRANGTVTVRTIAEDPSAPALRLNYVALTQTLGGQSTLVDQYSEAGGTYLANIAMGVWNVAPDNQGRYAWANLYSKYAFNDAKLPFPSVDRFKFYDIRIFPDSVSLYGINKPISLPPDSADHAKYMKQFELGSYALPTFDLTQPGERAKRSKALATALDTLIPIAMANAKARNVGLEYIGHAGGTGGLLEGLIVSADAKPVLQHLVELNGKKLAYFDAGTNCDESSTLTLDDMAPYVDYQLVSEFERGGYELSCNTSSMDCWYKLTNSAANTYLIRPYFFASNISMAQSLYLESLYYRHAWYSERGKVNGQSVTLIDSAAYLAQIGTIKQLVLDHSSLFADQTKFKITSPTAAAVGASVEGHRDLGKVLDAISPDARKLMNKFTISVVSTETILGQTWDASGVYLYAWLLTPGYWITR